jgi:hypothetical protein
MSLDWSIEKIANNEQVCMDTEGNLNVRTEILIFTTMTVGIPRITEKNAEEFFLRASMIERVNGTALRRHDSDGTRVDIPLERADVLAHIGLSTNADTKSETQFAKTVYNILRDRVKRSVGG